MRLQLLVGALALTLLSCQSPTGPSSQPPPGSATTASPPRSTMNAPASPSAVASIELTYKKKCPGMPQARRVRVSSLTSSLTVVDEAGEAHSSTLTPDRIAALGSALKQAGLDRLSSAPGASKEPCSITLHAVLDGAVKDVEESPTVAVNDAAAWKAVQKAIEDFAYAE